MQNNMLCTDCISYAKTLPDKHFFLTIADPPYFSGPERREYYGRKISPIGVHRVYEKSDAWKLPTPEDFDELQRVWQNLIVWGVNYFDVPFGPGRIVWDKCNGSSSFSDCELAYCSMWKSVRLFRFMWNGMLQGKSVREGHVMQGDKGRNETGLDYTGCETDASMYKKGCARFEQHAAQQSFYHMEAT